MLVKEKGHNLIGVPGATKVYGNSWRHIGDSYRACINNGLFARKPRFFAGHHIPF